MIIRNVPKVTELIYFPISSQIFPLTMPVLNTLIIISRLFSFQTTLIFNKPDSMTALFPPF